MIYIHIARSGLENLTFDLDFVYDFSITDPDVDKPTHVLGY
jgi:hypothetical protein